MNQMEIGKFMAMLRKEKGLTQSQLADILNVSNKSISRWENGKTLPDISLYESICSVFNISITELLYAKKMDADECFKKIDKISFNIFFTKSQLETYGIFVEILIFVGIIITISLANLKSLTIIERVITLCCGSFVWLFGLIMRIKLKKIIQKINDC